MSSHILCPYTNPISHLSYSIPTLPPYIIPTPSHYPNHPRPLTKPSTYAVLPTQPYPFTHNPIPQPTPSHIPAHPSPAHPISQPKPPNSSQPKPPPSPNSQPHPAQTPNHPPAQTPNPTPSNIPIPTGRAQTILDDLLHEICVMQRPHLRFCRIRVRFQSLGFTSLAMKPLAAL